MDLDDRFASRVVEVEENTRTVPPCAARHLSPGEPVNLLVYGPAFAAMDLRMPATVVALTNRSWLVG